MDQPSVYPLRYPSKFVLITILLICVLLSFLAGYFSPKFTNSSIPTKPNPVVSPSLTVKIPIESGSSAVKSLYVVYFLTGVVENINPTAKNNSNGYEIQMLSPTGPLINYRFFVSGQTTNVVLLDNKGQETKSQLSSIKKGDSIQLNYQLDIKKGSADQVTKIAVLK